MTNEQKTIILGMARNIMYDATIKTLIGMNDANTKCPVIIAKWDKACNELDFSQRRLEVYLEGLVREGGK